MKKKSDTKAQDETTTTEIRAPKAKRDSRAQAKAEAKAIPAPKPEPADDAAAKAAAKQATKDARDAKEKEEAARRLTARTNAHAEIARLVEAESARRLCLCGCGNTTPRAFFVPGHDSKLLSRLIEG